MACVPHPSAPAAPSRQALDPSSLPSGKGTQAKTKQASHGICSLSFWTKGPAGCGWRTGEEGTEIESEGKREGRDRKGKGDRRGAEISRRDERRKEKQTWKQIPRWTEGEGEG